MKEEDFEPLSTEDLTNLKEFGTITVPSHISRIMKQVYEIIRPHKMKVINKTLFQGYILYKLEYGVSVLVKKDKGLWMVKPR